MKSIEKLISPLIESQFPSFYKEEGPQFIAFVKAYYQWMEQTGNPLNISRNLLTYKDIDTTLDDWGLLINDTLFIDKPNTAVFLYGQEETHSRPEYTSNNSKDYSLQLFINFAPKDFWFFKGDYKKALKYTIPSPVMYDEGQITQI